MVGPESIGRADLNSFQASNRRTQPPPKRQGPSNTLIATTFRATISPSSGVAGRRPFYAILVLTKECQMEPPRPIPTSLKIVAGLFIFSGICSVIDVIISLMHGNVNFNFGVLGLFIGPGLLRLRPAWRTCALVFIWIAMIVVPLATLLMLVNPGPIDISIFGRKVGHASKVFGVLIGVVLFVLTIWQYRILTRPDVRRLFGLYPRRPSPPPDLDTSPR